jgi:hypothetical protein
LPAKALGLPPPGLSVDRLPWRTCSAERLIRVSSRNGGEPHFGRTGANRFDAPGCTTGHAEFSSCYLGLSLPVAIAESVLHDEIPIDGEFQIAQSMLDNQYVIRFKGAGLRLACLTGATLKRFGGNADLAGTTDYATTQQWSLSVHRNPGQFDGFIYMSRHLNTAQAVVLFDRANERIQMACATKLVATPGFARAAKKFHIVGI